MSKYNTDVVYKITKEARSKNSEMGYLYFKDVPVTFAQVLKPGKKLNSDDTAYSLNLFINQDTMDKLEKIGLNKEMAEVGVTKIKKGPNRGKVKYPLNEHNKDYAGMFAAQFSRNTVKRDANGAVVKEYEPLKVVDAGGDVFTENVGNGSVCHVKMFAYRNVDGMLVVQLDAVIVVEHVPYEGGGSSFDDELGIEIKSASKNSPKSPVKDISSTEDELGDDTPFDDDF